MKEIDYKLLFLEGLAEPDYSRVEFWAKQQPESGYSRGVFWMKLNDWFNHYNQKIKLDIESQSTLGNKNINTLDGNELGTANSSYTKKFSGYGVGVGFRTLIADNFYGNLEVQRVFYSRENVSPVAFDADSTIGSLGLSYKF